MNRKLRIFISSTSDLEQERDAVERVLSDLEMEGSRFETWTSSPRGPIEECLLEIEESDGMVLILGSKYGSIAPDTRISVTHLEYRHGRAHKRPILVFVLAREDVEEEQKEFIQEVESELFRRRQVKSIEELTEGVRGAVLKEIARCWRSVHSVVGPSEEHRPIPSGLPANPREVLEALLEARKRKDDLAIHKVAEECERRFGDDPRIMGIVFASEADLAGYSSEAEPQRLRKAIGFWEERISDEAEQRSRIRYNQANALHALGRWREAKLFLEEAVELLPEHAEAWKNLGNSLFDLGERSEAYRCFERAVELKPNLAEGLVSIAVVSMERGDFRKAVEILERVPLGDLPEARRAHVYYFKTKAYLMLGDIDKALESADECVSLAEDEEWAWDISARAYEYARGQSPQYVEPAVGFFQRMVAVSPYLGKAWAAFGFSLWRQWDPEREDDEIAREMLEVFSRAKELGAEDDGLMDDRMGHALEALGDLEESEERYRKAVQGSPKSFNCCLAEFLIRRGRFAEAIPLFEEVIGLGVDDSVVWNKLGLSYSREGQLDKAIGAYRRSVELEVGYANSWFNLGGMLFKAKDFGGAIEVLEEAIERFPDDPMADSGRMMLGLLGRGLPPT